MTIDIAKAPPSTGFVAGIRLATGIHPTAEYLRDCLQRGAMRWGTTYHI